MNETPWRGKVAVITGASRGIGAGLASTFAAQGVRLALCARHRPAVPDGAEAISAALDVVDADAVQGFCDAAVARFGHVDLWVNNAGLLEPIAPLARCEADAVAALLRVNIEGVFNGARAFVRHLHRRRAADPSAVGVLVNLSSGAARNAYAGWSAYCASKAAVERLSECLQLEEASNGLRVLSLAPGVVDTDMQATIRATPEADFPLLAKFQELKQRETFNSPAHVARHLLAIAFDPARRPATVATSVPAEHP